jgi:hypothetical protein
MQIIINTNSYPQIMNNDEQKITKYGSREDVFLGRCEMTKGKLTKADLEFCEKTGKYKSVRAVARGKALIEQLRSKQQAVAPVIDVVQETPVPFEASNNVEVKVRKPRAKKTVPFEAKSSSKNSLDASNNVEAAVEVKVKRGRKKKVVEPEVELPQ